MSFLSRPNYDHVFGLAFQYLQDTQTLYVTKEELQKLVADTMMMMAKEHEKDELDVEMWNKQTIAYVRDAVRKKKTIAVQEEEGGDPFFDKLQELEVARKSGNVWMQQSTPAPSAVTVPVEPASVPSVTTIYMQAPPEKGHAIHIRSWHRPWTLRHERAVFSWSGPFPMGMDVNSTYISSVIVPKQTMTFTPYVILEIEGAGGQVNECVLIPDSKSVNATWEYLRPTTKALGYIRPLALPWTLRFLDADREVLPYGQDHWVVQEVAQLSRVDVSRLTIHNGGKTENLSKEFTAGEWILIESNVDKQVRCKVVAVGPDTIDVQEKVDASFRGANILHLHRQTCVILETTNTVHTKK